MYLDPTMLLLIPGLLLAWYAQARVSSTFQQYSQIQSYAGIAASAVARRMLDINGLAGVPVKRTEGSLTDNYNPRKRTLNLSQSVYGSASLAALGVAAHEVGHAVQHSKRFAPLVIRGALVPVANIGTYMAFPLLILGMLLSYQPLVWIGVGAFGLAVLFYLVTLPVEYDASRRALQMLREGGYLAEEEVAGARKVLSAAALTYLAAALTALLQFLRLFLIASSGRRRS